MRKVIFLSVSVIFCLGCSSFSPENVRSKVGEMVEEPPRVIRDQHFQHYKEDIEALEHSYLNDEMDYVEYIEKRKKLDDTYTQEVQRRDSFIIQDQSR